MMRMLDAGGIPGMTDHERVADDDNPMGYFELQAVKRLPEGDHAWLSAARGQAVKVIFSLLPHLPPGYRYKAIFMRRSIDEILASQRTMLLRRGKDPGPEADPAMRLAFEQHIREVSQWARRQAHMDVLEVSYNALVANPDPVIDRLCLFLGNNLNRPGMAAAIDPRLYRQRRLGGYRET